MTDSPADATPYEVLGVPATADDDALRRAGRVADRGREVGERLGGGAVWLEAELAAHPGGVDPAAEGEEAELLG